MFASPKYPRLLNPDSLRTTIVQGVTNGQIAYVGKNGDIYEPLCYQTETGSGHIDFSDDMFIITRENAEKYLAAKVVADLVEVAIEGQNEVNGKTPRVREETDQYTATVGAHHENSLSTQPAPASTQVTDEESIQDETVHHLAWSGEIPPSNG